MKFFISALLCVLASTPALAQQPQQYDPRLAVPLIQALQGQVTYQQAVIKALQEDEAKKDAELAGWFKGWFGEAPSVAEVK